MSGYHPGLDCLLNVIPEVSSAFFENDIPNSNRVFISVGFPSLSMLFQIILRRIDFISTRIEEVRILCFQTALEIKTVSDNNKLLPALSNAFGNRVSGRDLKRLR